MKKILVGLVAIGLFVLYSLGVRHQLPTAAKSDGTSSSQSSNTTAAGQFKNGTYKGSVEDAFYGNVQVAAIISGGKLTDVNFLSYPTDHQDSVLINQQAAPQLKQEAIQAQSAHVQAVTGATFTSEAFVKSLSTALIQAKT